MRYKKVQDLAKYVDGNKDGMGGASGEKDSTSQEDLVRTLQLIDTTLLKCYIKVSGRVQWAWLSTRNLF